MISAKECREYLKSDDEGQEFEFTENESDTGRDRFMEECELRISQALMFGCTGTTTSSGYFDDDIKAELEKLGFGVKKINKNTIEVNWREEN